MLEQKDDYTTIFCDTKNCESMASTPTGFYNEFFFTMGWRLDPKAKTNFHLCSVCVEKRYNKIKAKNKWMQK